MSKTATEREREREERILLFPVSGAAQKLRMLGGPRRCEEIFSGAIVIALHFLVWG